MRKERKHFTPEEKVAILRRHLEERDRKLGVARQQRQSHRQQAA